jgi:pyruvate/2-oxoglutarate/acetoin dehydrogenase E1 component
MRSISFAQAINETLDQILLYNKRAFLIGEGVPDQKAVFGTTKGLKERYDSQVFDMPISEAGLTGVCIGAALNGTKPILVHQRMDFSLYSADQLINNAAKWYSMFGGRRPVPLTIRMIIGRGWGQGNQHSQNLQALYSHIPGLKVFVPSSPSQAKGLLYTAFMDPNPCLILEHKWLYNMTEVVPAILWTEHHGTKVKIAGCDITIVASGPSTQEALLAQQALIKQSISAEVLDLQRINPLDTIPIIESCRKTRRLLVLDDAWKSCGVSAEIIASVMEDTSVKLNSHPRRLTYPDFPSPSTHALAQYYYFGAREIVRTVGKMFHVELHTKPIDDILKKRTHDVDPYLNKVTSAI